jgi:hypothetical protein
LLKRGSNYHAAIFSSPVTALTIAEIRRARTIAISVSGTAFTVGELVTEATDVAGIWVVFEFETEVTDVTEIEYICEVNVRMELGRVWEDSVDVGNREVNGKVLNSEEKFCDACIPTESVL